MISPFSAETILALTQNGAKGETGEEIRTALHLPNTKKKINSVFKSLLPKLKKNEGYTFHTANKIYVRENYPIIENFTKIATETYQSSSENIDFSKNIEAAEKINNWVSEQTNQKIKNLISSQKLSEDTVALLINALYFSAPWKKPFKTRLTQNRDFYKTPEEVIQVTTMKKIDNFGYFESEDLDAKFLQMPFRSGKDIQMVVVLPNKKDGLKNLESQIEEIYKISKFNWEFVSVTIPKFKIETSVDFKTVLKKLGVTKAFRHADFSGLAGEKGEIFISDVLQKTFIEVNENGVDASAATAGNTTTKKFNSQKLQFCFLVVFHPKSLMQDFGDKKIFEADHPFLFYIKINDVVIFTGRVLVPEY